VPAGRQLKGGLELGIEDVNRSGGVDGRLLELLMRDSAGLADRATSALRELDSEGIVALAGEFHSVVARPLAELADSRGLPFVCSSATLDELTSAPAASVGRIAAPQSHGWRVYADYLVAAGHAHVALAIFPDEYWSSGAAVLEARLREKGVVCTRIDVTDLSGFDVADRLRRIDGVAAVLLLAGYPEPSVAVVKALRSDARFDDLLIGDPAGRAEFAEWRDLLGRDGVGVPYLRYTAAAGTELGASVAARLSKRLGEPASFVALEGYDTIQVVAEALRLGGDDRVRVGQALTEVEIQGTRGPLRFSRTAGVPVLQWVWPPVEVAAHTDPAQTDRVTILHEEHGNRAAP
jgi:ABC-type branched-subunit amino acid transport system substrate-binding protein